MQQVCVIGAGVIGLTSALALQDAGCEVTLIDSQPPGSGCSKGNAGHFATEQVFPLAQPSLLWQLPKMLLDPLGPLAIRPSYFWQALPWFSRFLWAMRGRARRANQHALAALNEHAMASWLKLVDLHQCAELIEQRGALLVSEQSQPDALLASFEQYQSANIALSWLDQEQLHAAEPSLHPRVKHGIHFKAVAHSSNPFLLSQKLFARFKARGGEFIQEPVQGIYADRQPTVRLPRSSLHCHYLVIAAGAHSQQLARYCGHNVPLTAERGYHLMVNSVPLSQPVTSLERKFIMTPMQHGLRLAGTVEFAGLHSAPNYRRASMLLPHGQALLSRHLQPRSQDGQWFGNRPSLPDSLPVLGPCPKHRGIFYNFGHQHLGLTQAAISAELLVAAMQQQRNAVDLSPYSIARFR